MDNLTVTILAAGEGKRMNSSLPKVLHLVKNRPMLVRIIETARLLNPVKIIVIVGKSKGLIEATVSNYIKTKDITFIQQLEPQGTGHAIKVSLDAYEEDGPVLILNGDMPLITVDVLKKIISNEHDASIIAAQFENPYGYGRIVTRKNGDVLKIIEEKDCTDSEREINTINTGIYCIHSLFLKDFVPKLDNDNAQKEYYLTDIIKLMTNRFIPVRSILLEKNENIYVSGVNTPEELATLEKLA